MSTNGLDQHPVDTSVDDESPEKLPSSAWASLVIFAAFVVLFGTCAATYMFN